VEVSFTVNNPPALDTKVFVTGSNATIGTLTREGTLSAGAGTLMMTFAFPTAFAASRTQFFNNNFQIAWTYRLKNSGMPPSAGMSTHTLYVTLAAAIAGTNIYRTSLKLSVPTGGDMTADAVFNTTWGDFAGPANVKNWNGDNLYYYRPPPGGGGFGSVCEVDDLLRSGNGSGQCNSWATFLQNAIAIHGIASDHIEVTATDGRNFMVKNWAVAAAAMPAGCETPAGQPTIEFDAGFGEMVPSPNGAASTVYCDYQSNAGLPGQNTPTPSEKVFIRHFIIKYTKMGQDCTTSDCYYDPSYGVTFRNEAGFQSNAVYAFVRQLPGVNHLKGRVAVVVVATPLNITFM